MTAIIKTTNLTKTYHTGKVEVRALIGVNISIENGEFLSIMGPSGSGKSTLMNILGCLDSPSDGEYLLDGIEAGRLMDTELAEIRNKKIGFVFQSFNLIPRISVFENVKLPLHYAGLNNQKERVLEALKMVRIDHRAHHNPNELSGGETQRAAIARAIVNNPPVILADEPTGNLDSKTGQEIINLFKDLNRNNGVTIIMVTHDKSIADQTQRIINLKDGRVV